MRYSLAAADICDCHKAGADADDFIAATIVDAIRNDQGVMIGCPACFDAHTGDDVASHVPRNQVIAAEYVGVAAITIEVGVSPCLSSAAGERAKITGQRYHGDGHGDDDKRD